MSMTPENAAMLLVVGAAKFKGAEAERKHITDLLEGLIMETELAQLTGDPDFVEMTPEVAHGVISGLRAFRDTLKTHPHIFSLAHPSGDTPPPARG